jgi:hypothetical protein
MGGHYSVVAIMAVAALAACGEQRNDLPTSPEFAAAKPACDFTNVSQLTKNEFGNNSTEAGYAGNMKFAGAGTDGATYNGYLILQAVAKKFDDGQDANNSLTTTNAALLTVALLPCMNTGGASIPAATVINSSLQWTGALGVAGLGTVPDYVKVQSHDGAWQLEPPGHFDADHVFQYDASWQDITTLKTSTTPVADLTFGDTRLADAILIYGSQTSALDFSNDDQISTVFDWSTKPAAVFGDGGVLIGECKSGANFLQHYPKSNPGVEVLGFVQPSCYNPLALGRDSEPRSFAERVFRLFSPAPAYATAVASTGTGTTKSTLSPYEVIFPGKTLLVPPFQWKKSGYIVNTYFPQIDYQATTLGGTKFLQPYILVWLEATNNQGAKVLMCNNWAYTNAEGKVSFTKAYLNKAGGYTITTRTAGALTITPQGGQEITIPTVPPSDPQISPLINVKNSTSTPPDACPSFKLGTDYTINADGTATVIHAPEAPGPNVIIAQ